MTNNPKTSIASFLRALATKRRKPVPAPTAPRPVRFEWSGWFEGCDKD